MNKEKDTTANEKQITPSRLMRKRKEIETSFQVLHVSQTTKETEKIKIELLLDIRELLISMNKPQVFLTPTQAVDELVDETNKKQLKFCDACHVEMMFINRYENKSGAEFHTYQCLKCNGKIDYAQVEVDGVKSEFSVHTNIVPKGAEKK